MGVLLLSSRPSRSPAAAPAPADAGKGGSRAAGARLVADLGGTRARFATVGATARDLERVEVFACASLPRVEDAVTAYLELHPLESVAEACFAVAGPADRDVVELSNSNWTFSRGELEEVLGAPVKLVNDFTAQALSLDLLGPGEVEWIGSPRPRDGGSRVVVGPGTGLGVAIQAPGREVLPSEGGHVAFAPTNDHEIDILRVLLARFGRVSAERLLSGPGLENLYAANLGDAAWETERISAPDVVALAHAEDPTAVRAVGDFLDILGSFAGDLALATWATGGVYLSGGVLRHLMPFFDDARFRARFEDKGRFSHACAAMPIAWIRAEHPGLLGCSAALEPGSRPLP